MVAIKGHYDGKVFVPDEPVDLPRNQSVILHVQATPAPTAPAGNGGFLKTLESLIGSVEAPVDWAAEHDHYLYGTPRRGTKGE